MRPEARPRRQRTQPPFHFLPRVREPSPEEEHRLGDAHTGDLWNGDTVILREEDLDHMGLDSVRRWIARVTLDRSLHVLYLRRRRSRTTWIPELVDDDEH